VEDFLKLSGAFRENRAVEVRKQGKCAQKQGCSEEKEQPMQR
jgi:hypothetical protein